MGTEVDRRWPWARLEGEGVPAQVERFLCGGAFGLMGGCAVFALMRGTTGIPFAAIALLSILLCVAAAFLFVELVCRRAKASCITIGGRAALFIALNSVGIAIHWLLLLDLMRRGTGDYLVVAILGAAVAVVWNYLLNLVLTWKV